MAKKSGIRINQIAKELGIPSTAILDKLKAEEVGDLNHQSTVSLGLAETIRSWFSRDAEAASTAVEIAAPVDVEAVAKPKTRRKPASKKTAAEEGAATDTAVAVETVADETAAKATATKRASRSKTAKASPDKETDTQTPAAASEQPPAESTSPTTSVTQTLAPVAPPPSIDTTATIEAPQQIPAPIEPVTAPQIVEAKTPPPAAAVAVPAAAASPQDAPVVEKLTPQQVRPTIRLGDRPQDAPATAKRKPVAAPKPFVPAPAKLQGPKVVREEKPDIVPAPRSRRPGQMQQEQPSFTQARPQQGRGVRVTTDEEDESADKKAATKARSLSSRRRSPDGRRGEAEEKLREFTDADLIERRERWRLPGHIVPA